MRVYFSATCAAGTPSRVQNSSARLGRAAAIFVNGPERRADLLWCSTSSPVTWHTLKLNTLLLLLEVPANTTGVGELAWQRVQTNDHSARKTVAS